MTMHQGQRYLQEIEEQPTVLKNLLRAERSAIEAIAAEIKRIRPIYGVLAGRGSSDNAARYTQYVLGVRNRLVCGLATPSIFTIYDSPPNMGKALTIGFSQSGQSPDIIRVVQAAAKQGAMTIAVTNDSQSPLARVAQHVISLHAGVESAVPATKTYTTELLVMAMLSAALQPDGGAWTELEQVPGAVQATLELNADCSGVEQFLDVKQLVVVGRGFNYATAFETALKISETTSVVALAFSSADLFHGPVALLGPETPLLLVAPRGKSHSHVERLLATAKSRKAPLIVVSDDAQLLGEGKLALALPTTPEWLSPVSAIVAGQLLSSALALAKGQEPDDPQGLTKVTRTY